MDLVIEIDRTIKVAVHGTFKRCLTITEELALQQELYNGMECHVRTNNLGVSTAVRVEGVVHSDEAQSSFVRYVNNVCTRFETGLENYHALHSTN